MADRSPGVSLWRVTTPASVIECTLEPLSGDWYEVRVSQDREVFILERFASMQNAQAYAAELQRKVAPLAKRDAALQRAS